MREPGITQQLTVEINERVVERFGGLAGIASGDVSFEVFVEWVQKVVRSQ